MRSVTSGLLAAAFLCWPLPSLPQDGGTPMERRRAAPQPGQDAAPFSPEQANAVVNAYIQARLKEGNGVFRLTDDRTGETLELEFDGIAIVSVERLWRIHDPTRQVEGSGYFACTAFHPVGAPREKLYDIDVWLSPRDGKLEVTAVLIHKEPRLVKGKWVKETRYTVGK